MANGLSSPDTAIGFTPSEVKAPPENFTPLSPELEHFTTQTPTPETGAVTTSEPSKYQEPTPSDPKIDQLMANIMSQASVKNPQEIANKVENNLPAETKKPQGFLAKIVDWILRFLGFRK